MKYQPPLVPGAVPATPGIHNADADAPYVNGIPETGEEGSYIPAEAVEHVQREVLKVIEEAGIEPDHEDLTQLWQALQWLAGERLVRSIGAGVPVYDGIGEDGRHRVRSLVAGAGIGIDLVEEPVGSGQHRIRISATASGGATGGSGSGGGGGACVPLSTQLLTFTGADQHVTAPAGATYMQVKLWGAGTGFETIAPDPAAGGYTEGWFAVAAGDQFSVMVGQGGAPTGGFVGDGVAGVQTYGFGGAGDTNGNTTSQGGGLTGIFTGTDAITAASRARALAIAGGGATGDAVLSSTIAGEQGNGSGGQANMQGANAVSSYVGIGSAGGGGYSGGNPSCGGSGYLHASKVAGSITPASGSSNTPANTSDVNYVAPLGAAAAVAMARGQHGLAVVKFFSGVCP